MAEAERWWALGLRGNAIGEAEAARICELLDREGREGTDLSPPCRRGELAAAQGQAWGGGGTQQQVCFFCATKAEFWVQKQQSRSNSSEATVPPFVQTGKNVESQQLHKGNVMDLQLSKDGTHFITASTDMQVSHTHRDARTSVFPPVFTPSTCMCQLKINDLHWFLHLPEMHSLPTVPRGR